MRAFNNQVEELELIAIPLKIINLLLTVEEANFHQMVRFFSIRPFGNT